MKVGICAIIKDCYKPYLFEWFDYHHSIGVDCFFIYDNESEVPISDIVNALPFKDDIHVEIITGTIKQIAAYHKCLTDIKSGALPACDRVAFIDEDEFIICENNDIKETLKEYEEFSGLGISWRMFGSSGIKEKTPEGQRSKFTQHTTDDFPPNQHIKSIVNPFLTERTTRTPHSFVYSRGNCVNVNKDVIGNDFTTPIYKKIWLDHYFTRSLEEWKEKAERGRSDTGETRSLSEFYEIDFNCSGKLKQIHLVMPFYRHENKQKLIDAYRPMNVILHPIVFRDEVADFNESWIEPFVIPMDSSKCEAERIECFKRNKFILGHIFNDGDYYVCVDDDDMYEPRVFDEIKKMDDDIVIISMKRGYQVPKDTSPGRRYSVATLHAHPDNVRIGMISAQQSFVKEKIFKAHLHNEESPRWDGELAIHHKESSEQIAYRPDLFALFNYYEKGRWEMLDGGLAFGVMVNDPLRLDMVLKRSSIGPSIHCHTITNPESATKGLNKLMDIIEGTGADVAILVHQDMYFRSGWTDQVKAQLVKLPENWTVAGVIGKDWQGQVCGKYHDMRIPTHFNTSEIHTFPHLACCFDEAVIIVNLKSGFRFDESMEGWDLYGTLAVLLALETGGTAWIIDAFCEHFILRPFTWFPSQSFIDNYKMLHDRFSKRWRVDSTALGMSPDPEERAEQERVFMASAAA